MTPLNFNGTIEDMIEEMAMMECKKEADWKIHEREWEISTEFAEWLFKKWLEER
jgi:hypothetical protein